MKIFDLSSKKNFFIIFLQTLASFAFANKSGGCTAQITAITSTKRIFCPHCYPDLLPHVSQSALPKVSILRDTELHIKYLCKLCCINLCSDHYMHKNETGFILALLHPEDVHVHQLQQLQYLHHVISFCSFMLSPLSQSSVTF